MVHNGMHASLLSSLFTQLLEIYRIKQERPYTLLGKKNKCGLISKRMAKQPQLQLFLHQSVSARSRWVSRLQLLESLRRFWNTPSVNLPSRLNRSRSSAFSGWRKLTANRELKTQNCHRRHQPRPKLELSNFEAGFNTLLSDIYMEMKENRADYGIKNVDLRLN